MPDSVPLPTAGWGLHPFLHVGPWQVSAYAVAMALAIAAGGLLYLHNVRRAGVAGGHPAAIVAAALLGGVLGAKLPIWAMGLGSWLRGGDWSWQEFVSGRTIAGGLVGGMLTVWLVKRRLGIRARYGNLLAPAIALGLAIGRVGCLLTGCCGGTPTRLPWGIDFGDGITRHPTQAYEIAFAVVALVATQRLVHRAPPGRLLAGFCGAYFILRFFEEFLRPGLSAAGLTPFQWICLAGLALLATREWTFHRLHSTEAE